MVINNQLNRLREATNELCSFRVSYFSFYPVPVEKNINVNFLLLILQNTILSSSISLNIYQNSEFYFFSFTITFARDKVI